MRARGRRIVASSCAAPTACITRLLTISAHGPAPAAAAPTAATSAASLAITVRCVSARVRSLRSSSPVGAAAMPSAIPVRPCTAISAASSRSPRPKATINAATPESAAVPTPMPVVAQNSASDKRVWTERVRTSASGMPPSATACTIEVSATARPARPKSAGPRKRASSTTVSADATADARLSTTAQRAEREILLAMRARLIRAVP